MPLVADDLGWEVHLRYIMLLDMNDEVIEKALKSCWVTNQTHIR
jgi:hypothetical protein